MSRNIFEKLVLLPLTGSCISHSSVAVINHQRCARKSKSHMRSHSPGISEDEDPSSERLLDARTQNSESIGFVAFLKSETSSGPQKLLKNVKRIFQLLAYKAETENYEMKIGLPTDVKHVTHIGWDGPAMTNPINGWEALLQPSNLCPLP